MNINSVLLVIKRELFSKGVNGSLLSIKEASLWFLDPAEAMHKCSTRKNALFTSNLFKDYEVVAFSDGYWNVQNCKAGMGDLIISKSLSIRYIISGPIKAINAFDAELAACMHIWRIIGDRCNSILYVDSKLVS